MSNTDWIAKKHPNPWRNMLETPASFAGIVFHLEQGGRASGRRTVVHEYPKRDTPYAEDMGRHARRFNFAGYLIYRPGNPVYEYTSQRVRLYNALEKGDSDRLVHPVFCPGGMLVQCERYSMVESRERGGFTQFDMQFVEAGEASNSLGFAMNTVSNVFQKADLVEQFWTGAIT